MKKCKFLIVAMMLITSAAVIVSCNRDKEPVSPSDGRVEVQFSPNIILMSGLTKASGSTWDASDAIGIYMFEENSTNVVESRENIEYVTEEGGKTGSFKAANTIIYFPDNGNKVRFMAYYPYLGSVTTSGDVYPVDVTNQSSQNKIDLLYSFNEDAKYDKTTPDKKVPLVFDHQLTKVYVNIKAGEGLTDEELQGIEITFDGLNTTAGFNLKDGSLNNPSNPADIDLLRITAKEGYVASFESIVIPSNEVPVATIVFDLKNGNTETGIANDVYTWVFNNALSKSTQYTYNVTINRSGIVVEATINDWLPTEDTEIDAE